MGRTLGTLPFSSHPREAPQLNFRTSAPAKSHPWCPQGDHGCIWDLQDTVSVTVAPLQGHSGMGAPQAWPTMWTFSTALASKIILDYSSQVGSPGRLNRTHFRLTQRSPMFLAPGTHFGEDNFSMDGEGAGKRMRSSQQGSRYETRTRCRSDRRRSSGGLM